MRRAVVWLLGAALMLTGCAGSPSGDAASKATATVTTSALPGLELESLGGGDALELGDLRGPAVLNLWASWCGPCRREMPVLEEFHQTHPEVQVLGIDFLDPQTEAAIDLVRRTGASYPMYVDPQGELSGVEPFPRLRGLPYTALIDARGRMVHGEFIEIRDVDQLERLVREHLNGRGLS